MSVQLQGSLFIIGIMIVLALYGWIHSWITGEKPKSKTTPNESTGKYDSPNTDFGDGD